MFTGIIEQAGKVINIETEGTNVTFTLEAPFGEEAIKVDQSIAHDGVCLTVTEVLNDEYSKMNGELQVDEHLTSYKVTAVEETLIKTRLGSWAIDHTVNIERCLKVGDRLDGHFVQGHVDTVGAVRSIDDRDGSWNISFSFPAEFKNLLVDKGSICINGVSLTVVESHEDYFSVTIIPYTWEHTNFHQLAVGNPVNLEFDILGKISVEENGMILGSMLLDSKLYESSIFEYKIDTPFL